MKAPHSYHTVTSRKCLRRKKQNSNYKEKFAGTKISGDNAEDRLWRSRKRCFGHGSETAL